jgi:hypothetical protein
LFYNIAWRWTLFQGLEIAQLQPAFLEKKYFDKLLHVPNLLILHRELSNGLLQMTILGLDVQLNLDLVVILPLLLYF